MKFLVSLALISFSIQSFAADGSTSVVLKPDLISTQAVGDKQLLKEVRLRSGINLSLANPLMAVTMDYRLLGKVQKEKPDGELKQELTAQLSSGAVNRLLGVNARIRTQSVVNDGSVQYRVMPELSKQISTARFDIRYSHTVDKPTDGRRSKETIDYSVDVNGKLGTEVGWRGRYGVRHLLADPASMKRDYSFDLVGKLINGALAFKGAYKARDERKQELDSVEQHRESIDVETRYKLSESLDLKLVSAVQHYDTADHRDVDNRRVGAGFSWSPAGDYKLDLQINRVDSRAIERTDYFTSGRLVWKPEDRVEVSLGYGDKLIKGERGILLHTKLDLNQNS